MKQLLQFFVLCFFPLLCIIQEVGRAESTSIENAEMIISTLRDYYEKIYTIQLVSTEKRFSVADGITRNSYDDVIGLKMNFTRKAIHRKIISSVLLPSQSRSSKPIETLLTRGSSLTLNYDLNGVLVISGDIVPRAADVVGIPYTFGSRYQIYAFGFFTSGMKVFHVLEWLENNQTKIISLTNEECIVESNGLEGNLKIILTNYDNSFYITSLSFFPSNPGDGVYSEVNYLVEDYRVVDSFWIPVQFEVVGIPSSNGVFRLG